MTMLERLRVLDPVHVRIVLATLSVRDGEVLANRCGLLGHPALGRKATARKMGMTLTGADQREAVARRKLEHPTRRELAGLA
jgi:hypothetical protein